MDLGELDLDVSPLGGPELIAAGVEEEPVEPRLEAIGVAQAGQIPPAPDERLLDGVLRTIGILEDESSRGVKPADRGACQQGEGVMIASPSPLHEVSLHVALGSARPVWSRLESIGGFGRGIVPYSGSDARRWPRLAPGRDERRRKDDEDQAADADRGERPDVRTRATDRVLELTLGVAISIPVATGLAGSWKGS
jgi:hypothetical protein